jgi:hypothetical protein
MNITESTTFAPDALHIPTDMTEAAWAEMHRTILLCRASSRLWLRQSRDYASNRWGVDYVAEAEMQMELELGLPEPKPEKPALNPEDKSRAIVTIEGICQSFALWQRKMAPEIERWDRDRLTKALALVEPIEAQAKRIRELLDATH